MAPPPPVGHVPAPTRRLPGRAARRAPILLVAPLALGLSALPTSPPASAAPAPVERRAETQVSGWSQAELEVRAGQRVTLRAKVRSTGRSGVRLVRLQTRDADGGAWRNDAWRPTTSGGAVRLTWQAPQDGAVQLRMVVRQSREANGEVTAPRLAVVTPSTQEESSSTHLGALQAEVLRLTNQARAQARTCGGTWFAAAPPVSANHALEQAASGHAADMAGRDYFAHDSLSGKTAGQRIEEAGYDWRSYGENLAAGQDTPAEVVQAWLDSPGHCAVLMNPRFTELGVGYAQSPTSRYGDYWVQNFGTR